jgi:KaiC/GvpD/RAD55 family RecA-like ATPase
MPSAENILIAKRAALEMVPIDLGMAPDDAPRGDDIPMPESLADYGLSADAADGPSDGTIKINTEPATPNGRTAPLKLTYFDDCGKTALRRWILKGIIARGETSAWVAPPGAGKSALLTEIAIHCAAMIDWRGHRAKEACGVVVFALERGDLFKRRLDYYRQRDSLHGLPIAVVDVVVDLLNPACVETIVATVREAERNFGCGAGMLVFDTYNKGIAAGGGDEDKARDQNRAAANLRTIHARLESNAHIALVGHTGKDESRGARGSNAHLGDVDVMTQISGEAVKTAAVVKGNDQAERTLAVFKMEVVETGRDEDSEAVTTSIVSADQVEAEPRTKKERLTANQQTLFTMLHAAGAAGLSLEDWNQQARDAGIGAKRKADLNDIRAALLSKGLVREYSGRWTIRHS